MSLMAGKATDAGGQPQTRNAAYRRAEVTMLALCFALGIMLGWFQPWPLVWPWLFAAAACIIAGFVLLGRRSGAGRALLLAAFVGVGAAWVTLRYDCVSGDDLAGWLGEEPMLVHLRGVALHEPVLRDQSPGAMGRFDYRAPATSFPMRVESLVSRNDEQVEVCGEVLVRVEGTVAPFHAGDAVELQGFLAPVGPPHNPGEFDYQRYARSLGQAGIVHVPGRSLLRVEPLQRGALGGAWLKYREQLRRRASAWLMADLPETGRSERDALLAALLLGQRSRDLDELGEAFREVGLAHLLAISGLHLGVLVGFVLMLARAGGAHRRWHGWLVIAVVLAYLVLVEVRMPVLRAAVMIIVASLGLVFGRRWRVGSLVALSAVGLLFWRPDQLFTPGFQLSFGVVLGLIHFAPIVRERWFGPADRSPVSSMQMIGQWLMGASAAAVTAWAIASPIVAWHFGFISPFGVVLSVLVLPLVAAVLVVGYVKMLLAVILPSAALLVGAALSICAEVLISIVQVVDTLPGSVVYVTPPSVLWTLLALAWVFAWGIYPEHWRKRRRILWLIGLSLSGWFFAPMWLSRAGPPLRIDMFSVGEGACLLIRSSGAAVMFDAGSSNDLNAGRRTIVPALRHLGVRRLDAIIISHADMDHYAAVLDVVDAFDVARVLVSPQLLARAEADPGSPVAFLIGCLTRRFVAVGEVSAGERREWGDSQWTWLHPPATAVHERANDDSMVISIRSAGRTALLTGDIQDEAIAGLLDRGWVPELRADILELPHHGGFSEATEQFVRRVDSSVVMQSAGRSRLRRDRWTSVLADRQRLITARDGACWVEVDEGGRISVGRFLHPEVVVDSAE